MLLGFALLAAVIALTPGANAAQSFASVKVALTSEDKAFRRAFDAMERKDWRRFSKAAARVGRNYVLRDYIDYWQLRREMNAAAKPQAALDRRVRRFINRNPRSLTADLLRKKWMLELGRREQWEDVLWHLPKWQRRNDTRVFCMAGRARLATGRPVGRQVIDAFNRDRNLGEECGPLATGLLAAGIVSKDTLRLRMWRALEVRDWRSVQTLGEILGLAPGQVSLALKKPTRVLREFESMSDSSVELNAVDRTRLLIALTRRSRPKPVDAAQWMQALQIKLRGPQRQFVWAQIAASAMRDMIEPAYEYTRKATGAQITDVTRQWLARAAMREHDWRLLIQIIGRMDPRTQSYSTWVYWRARAMRELGEGHGAQALLRKIAGRHHYYGRLAAEELGELVQPPAKSREPNARLARLLGRKSGFVRAQKFYDLGIRYQGNREWNYQARGMSDTELIAMAHFACQNNLYERCISMAERTRDKHDFGLRFVSPYRKALQPVAKRRGLDLAWIYGLIRQESRFQSDARSSAGARGLMQIMPSTGRWIASKMKIRGFRSRHLYDAQTNLNFGTYYLKAVYDDLQNSALLASAAYNAGPRHARRWRASLPADVDGALFVEIIPFRQTRTYVKKVLLNTAYYESAFSGQPQSLKALLGTVRAQPYESSRIP